MKNNFKLLTAFLLINNFILSQEQLEQEDNKKYTEAYCAEFRTRSQDSLSRIVRDYEYGSFYTQYHNSNSTSDNRKNHKSILQSIIFFADKCSKNNPVLESRLSWLSGGDKNQSIKNDAKKTHDIIINLEKSFEERDKKREKKCYFDDEFRQLETYRGGGGY